MKTFSGTPGIFPRDQLRSRLFRGQGSRSQRRVRAQPQSRGRADFGEVGGYCRGLENPKIAVPDS